MDIKTLPAAFWRDSPVCHGLVFFHFLCLMIFRNFCLPRWWTMENWGREPLQCCVYFQLASKGRVDFLEYLSLSVKAEIKLWKGPYKTSNYWADLPSRIDAVYRVPEDRSKSWASGNVRFFSGQKYWEFKGFRIVPGFPKSISELGLPTSLRFNAAINMWAYTPCQTFDFLGDEVKARLTEGSHFCSLATDSTCTMKLWRKL